MQISYRTYNSYHGVVYCCPNITKQNNEQIHNAISEVSKGDCIIRGDFNHEVVEDQTFLFLVQDNFLTQHVCVSFIRTTMKVQLDTKIAIQI